MFDRFNDHARQAMGFARDAALKLGHEYIGSEHILLALTQDGGLAGEVLRSLDVTRDKVRGEVEALVPRGPSELRGQLPFTPRARDLLEAAVAEARDLDHAYVGSEHLLLGLLRQEEGVALQVLQNLGARRDEVGREVLRRLGAKSGRWARTRAAPAAQAPPPGPADAAAAHALLVEIRDELRAIRRLLEERR